MRNFFSPREEEKNFKRMFKNFVECWKWDVSCLGCSLHWHCADGKQKTLVIKIVLCFSDPSLYIRICLEADSFPQRRGFICLPTGKEQ